MKTIGISIGTYYRYNVKLLHMDSYVSWMLIGISARPTCYF